jgi:hypothetical protein
MATRFEDVPDHVVKMVNDIRKGSFPELSGAKIKVLYDTKKRTSGGKLVLGRMQKTNDLIKTLTVEDSGDTEGYDYLMMIDKACFENVENIDKTRILRRLLQHCDVDLDSNNPYKIRNFEIEEWYDEMEYNKEDPRWMERCLSITESVYESE